MLKSNEERQNETDWQELTTADGKTFYYNPKIKKSVWKMPPELKALKDKQVSAQAQPNTNLHLPGRAETTYACDRTAKGKHWRH